MTQIVGSKTALDEMELSSQLAPTAHGRDTRLHVIVIALVGGEALIACLRALAPQCGALSVIGHSPPTEFPNVKELPVPPDLAVPHRRMLGLQASGAPFVGFVEDTCIPSVGWAAGVCDAFSEPSVAAVSGGIEISRGLCAKDRALALCEYAAFGANIYPARARRGASLTQGRVAVQRFPGSQFVLRSSAVAALGAWPEGLVDNELFDRFRAGGWRMVAEPAMRSTYAFGYRQGALLSTRYHHGRIYGGHFAARLAVTARVAAAIGTLLAPFLLTARTLRASSACVWASPATLWWIFSMHAAWSLGESVGKLTGDVGDSFARWR